jgi:Kae1-associated kinase Bud32
VDLKAAGAAESGAAPLAADAGASARNGVFSRGAEATLRRGTWFWRGTVAKEREAKAYRHKELDARLRQERTRDEANLLAASRATGVPVPVLYDTDRGSARLVMEEIAGTPLRDGLPSASASDAAAWMEQLGAMIGRLHAAGICHGDLTPGNVMRSPDGSLVVIDFGLGSFSQEEEPQAVDLHLLEEALEATDARAPALMAAFLQGYSAHNPGSKPVLARLEEIRRRGRYR